MSARSPDRAERRLVQGMLDRLGVPRDGVLLVHAAFRQFGLDGYGPDATVEALVAEMAPGTLLLPAMSWRYVTAGNPVFDELATPSNVGVMTEIFRTGHATHRSLHPTHSVAGRGPQAAALLADHHRDRTPCGSGSPFGRLAEVDARVVMMNVGMDCCTLVHAVEEEAAIDLYLKPVDEMDTVTCRDREGSEHAVTWRRHLFLPRDYWQFQDMLAERGRLGLCQAGNAVCVGFRAQDLVECVRETLTERPDAIIAKDGQRYRLM